MEYETEYYVLSELTDKEDKRYYTVVNKATGIVEYEDNILPRTIDALNNLQTLLEEAIENHKKKDRPALTVVGKEILEDGEDSVH